jgi:hypothetical protein
MKEIDIYLKKSGGNYDIYDIRDILNKLFKNEPKENVSISYDRELDSGNGLWVVAGVVKSASKDQIKKAFKKWSIYDLGVSTF